MNGLIVHRRLVCFPSGEGCQYFLFFKRGEENRAEVCSKKIPKAHEQVNSVLALHVSAVAYSKMNTCF